MTPPDNSNIRANGTLWAATAIPAPDTNAFSGREDVDVGIVGAGVAGLSIALYLAKAGFSVVILEAQDIGAEATGKSGGILAPDFVKHTPTEVEKIYGTEKGQRLVQLIGSSVRNTRAIISDHKIECDIQNHGFWIPAHNEKTNKNLEKRAEDWRSRGFDVDVMSSNETGKQLGTSRYKGSIRFEDGGSLNPLSLSRGLARAVLKQKARIYTSSPVQNIKKIGNGWALQTENGQLRCGRIVLAANGGNSKLHPKLAHSILPLHVHEFATVPLSDEQRQEILSSGAAFTDKQPYIFTARYDAEGRLIAAFPATVMSLGQRWLLGEASRRLKGYYPALKNVSIEYLWKGTAWISPSLLPKIYRLDTGFYAVQACNGRGLAANMVIGEEMGRYLASDTEKEFALTLESPPRIRAYSLTRSLPSLLMLLAYTRNRLKVL